MQEEVLLSIWSGLKKNVSTVFWAAWCNPSSCVSLPSNLLNRDNWLLLEGSEEEEEKKQDLFRRTQGGKRCQGETIQFVQKCQKPWKWLKDAEVSAVFGCWIVVSWLEKKSRRKKKKTCKELQSLDVSNDELWNQSLKWPTSAGSLVGRR